MSEQHRWEEILLTDCHEAREWELFHENSKIGRYTQALPQEEVRARMSSLYESLPYVGYPVVDLPHMFSPLPHSLEQAITSRTSVRNFSPASLTLEKISTILHFAYGITREANDPSLPRSFRVVPSGGALYPLEIFFHTACVKGLQAGLYHYNPLAHHLSFLRNEDGTERLLAALVQPELARGAAIIIFLTALFERSTFKYGNRGYRFILLEAGHVAQNVNLVATALGLGSVNIGGYFDREVDDFLEIDGVTHSTIYLIAIGEKE